MRHAPFAVAAIVLCGFVCVKASGARPPADADEVNAAITRLLTGPGVDFDVADISLQYEIPTASFPLIEAAVDRPDLPPESRAWLKQYVERERPRVAARLRKHEQVTVRNEWNIRTANEAYQKFGHHDPRWDADAIEGIKLFTAVEKNHKKSNETLARAVAAGCDDPFVLYCHARSRALLHLDPDKTEELMVQAAEAMNSSKYPPVRKVLSALSALEYLFEIEVPRRRAGGPRIPGVNRLLDTLTAAFINGFDEVIAQGDVPERELEEIAVRIVSIQINPGMDRKKMFDPIYEPLKKALPQSATPEYVKGLFYVKYAWDARGGGFANTVTPEGWKLMHERLDEAQAALELAWQRNPTNSKIADEMMAVALGEGWSLRKLDTWFLNAVHADPDDRQAYSNKLYFLEPKWHGSPEAMIAFGRECLATHNWYGEVPFMLITAHDNLAAYAPNKEAYFQSEGVWADIQSVYVPYFKARPGSVLARSSYCKYACLCGQWDEADAQFKILGDKAAAARFGSKEEMERLRAEAAAKAKH